MTQCENELYNRMQQCIEEGICETEPSNTIPPQEPLTQCEIDLLERMQHADIYEPQ